MRVEGRNKALLELGGRPMLARVVAMLQRVPEVSEVVVVGPLESLEPVLRAPELEAELRKPLTLIPQFRNLMENAWESYRRLLPDAPPEGRDPATPEEEALRVLYLSTDLPFASPQEVSSFIQRSLELDCDYTLGLVPEEAMTDFYPVRPGEPGITMAYFNIAAGRFRQSNLHLVRPARLGNRQRIEDMYEHRYQKQLGNALILAWRMATERGGGLWMVGFYCLMHLAGLCDRHGFRRLADWLRAPVTFERLERACSSLLDTRYRFVITDIGGAAVDIDNEHDLHAARSRLAEWTAHQERRAEEQVGPRPLPERSGGEGPVGLRIWREARIESGIPPDEEEK